MNLASKNRGLVDVVIPAYNAARYIEETLLSVAKQGDALAKVIVVNDGSSDSTAEIVSRFAASHPTITIQIINQENAGLSAARNAGIKAATAPYIAFLDADDLWLQEKLNMQLAVFNHSKDEKLGLVYCAYGVISETSTRLPTVALIHPKLRGNVARKLLLGNFISGSGSAVLIKKSVFDTVGLFDEKLSAGEDWDMWLRISQSFHADYCPEELVLIRLHDANMQKDTLRMLSADLMILNKFEVLQQSNFFLLWKIRTILFNQHMTADAIPGFGQCAPSLQEKLSGLRLKIAFIAIAPLAIIAKAYLSLKS
ncbi:glycosyltransferase family A protein [Polynucleobacter sp. AP-Latsch-80-C2]|jgi:glycosyltransferase involved in cell wall biosynthesis|uniref:glycosyltransferase family 2 protein n=1 Tax=Polynucleobacter sp. AP-Latsch-80-C2 TaxID=2576931 RepID=UPI001C0B20E3|nr:glycosyltransferase family A protein [Polynucleobacter sp. AP-Latsch-80-C2]MBU3623197.1 glycosyltransferase family 2 protein [Polynucleobacter sp. AP-Latsch-80-C2]